MTPEEFINYQKNNTLEAYDASGKDYSTSTLDDIVYRGIERKQGLFSILQSEAGVLSFERPLDDQELIKKSYRLETLAGDNPSFAFNFANKQVTERETGKCLPLKKWLKNHYEHLEDYWIEDTIREAEATKTLLIAAHPWFLIGSSVAAGGRNVESSCHHPASSAEDYKSGAIAYSLDKQTLIFGVWDTNADGLSGRQLVWIDKNAPGIVTGRKYGEIGELDSSFLRKLLYPLISPEHKT